MQGSDASLRIVAAAAGFCDFPTSSVSPRIYDCSDFIVTRAAEQSS
jgi:hypothetical protein